MNKLISTAIAVLVLGATAAFSSPQYALLQMKSAIADGDSESLKEYIDFDSVRRSVKDQLTIQMTKKLAAQSESDPDNPFEKMGEMLALAMVDKVVDMYVTPAGLTEAMKGGKLEQSPEKESGTKAVSEVNANEAFENAEYSFDSLSKYTVSMLNPKTNETMKFVLRRDGLSWQLSDLVIPIKE